MDTVDLVDHVAGRDCGAAGRAIAAAMDKFCPQYGIDTPLRLAHFLAQAAHETEDFRFFKEIWGPTAAQRGYEGRKDLGNTQPGDGFRYRGRGIFEETGRYNYERTGRELGIDLVGNPDQAAEPYTSVQIACLFWRDRNINAAADADDVKAVTRKVNGGLNGLVSRTEHLRRAKEVLLGH